MEYGDKLECRVDYSNCHTYGHEILKSELRNSISSDSRISGYDFHLFGHMFSMSICMNSVVCVLESHGLHMEFDNVDYIIVDYYYNHADVWGYKKDDSNVFMLCLNRSF